MPLHPIEAEAVKPTSVPSPHPKAREALTDTLASALFRMASVLDDPLQRLDEVSTLYTRLLRDFPPLRRARRGRLPSDPPRPPTGA